MIYQARRCEKQPNKQTVCGCAECEMHRHTRYVQRTAEIKHRDEMWERDQYQRRHQWLEGRRPRGVR